MAEPIRIKIDTSEYMPPEEEDIEAAKLFILQREENARRLEKRIDEILADAAARIVIICYRYKVDPKLLYFSVGFNEQMMDEIAAVMDEIEEKILDLILEYATRVTGDRTRIAALLQWLATLGRGNRNLKDTLDGYLFKTMKDWEAAIAALIFAGADETRAVTKIKTHLHTIYTMPEVTAAFRIAEKFTATYIRRRGVTQGGVGLSNNGSTNVTSMAKTTLQMAWMRDRRNEMEEDGAAGYYVLRGSTFPCDLCDSMTGFHPIEDTRGFPPYHPHCCCFVVPIKAKNNNTEQLWNYQQQR